MTKQRFFWWALLLGINLPSSLCVGHSDIPFSNAACNLGVILTASLHWRNSEQTLSTCIPGDQADLFSPTVFFFWRCQNSTFLYCFLQVWLLAGSPQVLLTKIQRVINCSAHLIFKVPKSAHITPFLYDLQWLPISSRIQYKIALICFHIVSGTVPPYLSALLHLCSPSHSLRSAADTRILHVPRMGRRTLGERSF